MGADSIVFDNDVPIEIDVIRELNKNDDLKYKYTYREFKKYKRRKSYDTAYGFDNPEDIDNENEW